MFVEGRGDQVTPWVIKYSNVISINVSENVNVNVNVHV